MAIGILALWYAARSGRRRFGLSVFALGAGLTVLDFLVVIPHFLGKSTVFGGWYAAVGGSPTGIARMAVTHPLTLVHAVTTTHKLLYVVLLFAPFLCLWSFEPLLVLAAAPDLAINLLANRSGPTSLTYHYSAGVVPFVVAASIFGLARMRRHARRLSLYMLVAVLAIAAYSPLATAGASVRGAFAPDATQRAKAVAVSLIPAEAPVAASNRLGAQLSNRHRIMLFPQSVREARWIVADEADPFGRRSSAHRIALLRHDARWRLVYSSHGIFVLRSCRPIASADARRPRGAPPAPRR